MNDNRRLTQYNSVYQPADIPDHGWVAIYRVCLLVVRCRDEWTATIPLHQADNHCHSSNYNPSIMSSVAMDVS